ncbi:MAG: hypothetical protein ACK4RS_03040 [Thiothrix sp.]
MLQQFNRWCNAVAETLHDALPMILVVIFYQMTVLELPFSDVITLLGWVLLVAFGIVTIV